MFVKIFLILSNDKIAHFKAENIMKWCKNFNFLTEKKIKLLRVIAY